MCGLCMSWHQYGQTATYQCSSPDSAEWLPAAVVSAYVGSNSREVNSRSATSTAANRGGVTPFAQPSSGKPRSAWKKVVAPTQQATNKGPSTIAVPIEVHVLPDTEQHRRHCRLQKNRQSVWNVARMSGHLSWVAFTYH